MVSSRCDGNHAYYFCYEVCKLITSLEKYVLLYETSDGKKVVNIPDYYDTHVAPLMGKFAEYSFNKGSKFVICPFHDDHDPSLGMIKAKYIDGAMVFHCLGCGASGTVVRLHQRIEREYRGREIDVKNACVELCNMFNIPVPSDSVFSSEDYAKKMQNNMMKVDVLAKKYTEADFARSILEARKNGVTLDALNSASVKMIATVKRLYV